MAFGFLKKLVKGVGKVAGGALKAAASKATHGLSDQVLKVLKGRGQVKQVLAKTGVPATIQEQALVRKLGEGYGPRVISTERVLADAGAGNGTMGTYSRKRMPGRAKRKPVESYRGAAPARAAARRGGMRRGMLDLKAISAAWRAAGKPGTWQGYIKSHPIYT